MSAQGRNRSAGKINEIEGNENRPLAEPHRRKIRGSSSRSDLRRAEAPSPFACSEGGYPGGRVMFKLKDHGSKHVTINSIIDADTAELRQPISAGATRSRRLNSRKDVPDTLDDGQARNMICAHPSSGSPWPRERQNVVLDSIRRRKCGTRWGRAGGITQDHPRLARGQQGKKSVTSRTAGHEAFTDACRRSPGPHVAVIVGAADDGSGQDREATGPRQGAGVSWVVPLKDR